MYRFASVHRNTSVWRIIRGMDHPIDIRPFCPADQSAARTLILAGLQEHWGTLDLTLNPDLDDIVRHYADGVFLTAWQAGALVGTGALIPEAPGVSRVVRMSVDRRCRRGGIGRRILTGLIDYARAGRPAHRAGDNGDLGRRHRLLPALRFSHYRARRR